MQGLMQGLTVWGIAIIVSMVVAVVIRAIVALLGRQGLHSNGATAPSAAGTYGTSAPGTPGADSATMPPDHVATIAAAVASVMDEPQIVRIEPSRHGSGWTAEGRIAHRGSHDTGRTPRRPTR